MKNIPVNYFNKAFISAINFLQEQKETLNKINVFPIADNDTGTNISISLHNLSSINEHYDNYHSFFCTLSEKAFIQARGNSGVLFSIWIEGMTQAVSAYESISINVFWDIIQHGYLFLFSEVKEIENGSLVTVIGDFSEFLQSSMQDIQLNVESIGKILKHLDTLVNETTDNNAVLKENKVVDAGALGFYYLMHGLLNALIRPEKTETLASLESNQILNHQSFHPVVATASPPKLRYCTEAILKLTLSKQQQAKKIISQYGDCDLFLSRNSALRFHVHCNQPAKLFDELSQIANISSPKIDDMLRQYQASKSINKIALISDSSIDLSDELLEYFQVHRIPASIMQGDNEWVDGCGIDAERLYEKLNSFQQYPTTATPALGKIKQTFEFLLQHYQHLLVISVSSKLSVTFNAITKVASNNEHIHLIDSQKNSGAHGLLVAYAGKLIREKYSIEEIIAKVLDKRHELSIFVSVQNFDATIRSGRMSPLKGTIAKISNIKPLLSLSPCGKGIVVAKVFSLKKSREKLIRLVATKHQQKPVIHYNLMHVDAEIEALELAEKLEHILKIPPLFVKPVSPSIGLHAGLGAIAVAIHQGDN